jgi:hypothetical protein
MRFIIVILILVAFNKIALGQMQHTKTEILVVGTIHTGNKYFSDKTLLTILNAYSPDVVLWEQSKNFKRKIGLLTAYNLKVVKRVSIEQIALQRYSRFKKNIKGLPYDTNIVSRNKYIRNLIRIKNTFFEKLNNTKKSFSDSVNYANFVDKNNSYYGSIYNLTLDEINKDTMFEKAKELNKLETEFLIPLAKKYVVDSIVVKEFENESDYWVARNNYMANQILRYSKQFEGKKILVFAGLNHKYFLLDKLKEHQDNIKILFELPGD